MEGWWNHPREYYMNEWVELIENLPLSMQNLQVLNQYLQMLPNFFAILKTLILRDSNLTIIPVCIEQCYFFELLDLCNRKQLQEIRVLPPSTNDFLAYNCASLKVFCSTIKHFIQSGRGRCLLCYFIILTINLSCVPVSSIGIYLQWPRFKLRIPHLPHGMNFKSLDYK
jgi:hypothetical protein